LAGDRKAYNKAIRAGLNLAWEGQWEDALTAYQRALVQMPDDPVVHSYVGLACLELERFDTALEAYRRASRLAPDDPAPLSRIAQIHEQLGQRYAAADAHFSVAELSRRQRNWTQAIQSLQHAMRLHPEHLPAQYSLVEIYTQLDRPSQAAIAHLSLARVLQRQGQQESALDHCVRATQLDPRNLEAQALVDALRSGKALPQIEPPPVPAEERASPADMARDQALEELAGIPFEEETPTGKRSEAEVPEPGLALAEAPRSTLSRPQIDTLIAQAIDFQTRGLLDEAIACYTKAIDAGVDRPAAHFNLGLLYRERLRFESAISEFTKAVKHPRYSLGSHFALGECYKALGRVDDALEHFVEALKIVDLGTVRREQADDLIQLYDALAESYATKGDREKAVEFTNSLIQFLSSRGWGDKAREARRRIDTMGDSGMTMSLAEVIVAPNASAILSAVAVSQELMKREAFTAATEVCYRAIESAPAYLPLHIRLAEILTENGRIEDAVAKYAVVADLYLVREEKRQAIGVYRRVLRLMPMDVAFRARLIDLLISYGEIDLALEQYCALADAYYQLAQVDKALETYTEAVRLTPRSSDERKWRVGLLHKMADMQMRRAKWSESLTLFRKLTTLEPDDERAWLHLIDLSYKLGGDASADREIVALIDNYHERGRDDRTLALLQEAVRLCPQQMALRARLARMYISVNMREEAVAELDMLGELQLDAGLHDQARATIRLIISLQTGDASAYRRLLAQL
jgi:tetratricopeptide (TPR) repeat protein